MYLRVWEYKVPRDRVNPFVAAYGASGDWARLFAKTAGFAGTELFQGVAAPDRFITIDRWVAEANWTAFLDEWQKAYDALDTSMADLATVESLLFEGTVPLG